MLRVFVLTGVLLLNEYSFFLILLFVHGFVATFEPAQAKGIIKSIISVDKRIKNYAYLTQQVKIFFAIVTILGVVILSITTFIKDQYSLKMFFSGLLFLLFSNYIYSQFILKLSILEYYGYFVVNRLYKLIFEAAFIATSLITYTYLNIYLVEFAYILCLATLLYFTNKKILKLKIIYGDSECVYSKKTVFNQPFWQQIEIQTWLTLVLWMPILMIILLGTDNQVAFYFAAAQLFQSAAMMLVPFMTAIFPILTSDVKNHDKYFQVSIVLIGLLGLFYVFLFTFVQNIIYILTNDKIALDEGVLLFVAFASFLELIHIKLRYFYSASNSFLGVLKSYRINTVFTLLLLIFFGLWIDFLSASFIMAVFFLLLINAVLLKNIETISIIQKLFCFLMIISGIFSAGFRNFL